MLVAEHLKILSVPCPRFADKNIIGLDRVGVVGFFEDRHAALFAAANGLGHEAVAEDGVVPLPADGVDLLDVQLVPVLLLPGDVTGVSHDVLEVSGLQENAEVFHAEREDSLLALPQDGHRKEEGIGLGRLAGFGGTVGVFGHDVLNAQGGGPLLLQLLGLPLLEQVKEGDDLEQFPLVAKIREEIDLDENVQLAGVQTAVMGERPEKVREGGVLPLGQGIELVHHSLTHVLHRREPLGNDPLFLGEEVIAAGDAKLGRDDGDAPLLGQGGAIPDVLVIGGVVEERRDELDGMVVAEVGTEVAEEAVGD